MVLCLLGGAWLIGVVRWTVTGTFFWKERGVSRPVTPESHPVLFWCWILVSFVMASLILGRGVIEFHRWWRGRRPSGKQE
jgi:hypothetical protein